MSVYLVIGIIMIVIPLLGGGVLILGEDEGEFSWDTFFVRLFFIVWVIVGLYCLAQGLPL